MVDGVSVTTPETGITVFKPGVHVRNSCISDFGKAVYGNGIWIFQEALDENNRISDREQRSSTTGVGTSTQAPS